VPTATFEAADLTSDALPPADLAYARYVLSHLQDPVGTVAGWRAALAPGGRLLVEENLELRIHHPTFRRYEDAVARVVGAGGGDLYVGRRLEPLADRHLRRTVDPPAGVVARMFRLNLVAWGGHPEAASLDVEALAADLEDLQASVEQGLLTFELAQLVFYAG
jgi:trans-aconitate 2-methyltransferase